MLTVPHQPNFMSTPLTGDALKARVAEFGPAAESEIAIACGYTTPAGKAKLGAFKDALLEAHGLRLKPAKITTGRKGKPLAFTVTTGKTGNIVMAGGYAALIGVKPGEQVQIAHQGNALILTAATPAVASAPVVTYDAAPQPVVPELAMA